MSSPVHPSPDRAERQGPPAQPAAALSATFTAEPVRDTLAFWFEQLGLDYRIEFAPYNQVFQQLLDPASLLHRTGPDSVNIVLLRLEDWANGTGLAYLEDTVEQFLTGLAGAAFRAPVIVCLCSESPAFLADASQADGAARISARLEAGIAPRAAVHLVTPAGLHSLYPVADYHDPHAEELGHVPYTPQFFAALGTMLARRIDALRRPPYKVIVLDADETMWKGVCSEDGPEGVCLDEDRRALQEFMRAQLDSGMLLALCSKNEEADVIATFRANPDWPLRLEHFAARRINWQPKSANLASMAEELSLGLDSFIFVDDNETECAEVQANCPEALTIPLPHAGVGRFLAHVWAFDRLETTREDRERSAMYAQNVERTRLEKQSLSLASFLEALRLDVSIQPPAPEHVARIAQLTQRTNQMNFTPVRRSEAEIADLLRPDEAECLVVHASDRFGSYGLVGVMLFAERGDALTIDTFLLSCRALGKGVEHRMLARLGAVAAARGLGWVEARFAPTARNRPALNLLRSIGGGVEQPGGFRFPAAVLADLKYVPSGRPVRPAQPRDRESAAASRARDVDYAGIAAGLYDPARILDAVRAFRGEGGVAAGTGKAAPRTELERELVALWEELLGVAPIGIHDNFFDLGGHSLLAVQLISRVRQAYDADLSLEVVYGGAFTVAELAKAVEMAEIEQAGAGRYATLLAEVEAMSDEEVRALLSQERPGAGAPNRDRKGVPDGPAGRQ